MTRDTFRLSDCFECSCRPVVCFEEDWNCFWFLSFASFESSALIFLLSLFVAWSGFLSGVVDVSLITKLGGSRILCGLRWYLFNTSEPSSINVFRWWVSVGISVSMLK